MTSIRAVCGIWLMIVAAACASSAPDPTSPGDYLRSSGFELPGNERVLLRWPDRKMPLKVHLPMPQEGLFSDPTVVVEAVRAGVLSWEGLAGRGQPSFEFVDRPADADIPIVWEAKPDGDWYIAHCIYDIQPFARRFGVARVLVTARWTSGRQATPDETSAVVTHEIGHALGLRHSPVATDIMFARYQDGVGVPSARDRNTLKLLYESPIGKRVGRPRTRAVEEAPSSPDEEDLCRYMGVVHQRARHDLDRLRKKGRLSKEEWVCAAKELAATDDDFTQRCEGAPAFMPEIRQVLRARYEACLGEGRADDLDSAFDFANLE